MSMTPDKMAPETSPVTVSRRTGVRRVNNLPVYLVGTIVGMFLLVMALVAADRADKQNQPAEASAEKGGNASMFAREIAGDRTGGIIEPARPPAVPDLPGRQKPSSDEAVLVAKPANPDLPPLPPNGSAGSPALDNEADRIRKAKIQMLEEAIRAKTSVSTTAPRSSSVPSSSTAANTPQTREEMLARLAAVRQHIDSAHRDDPTAAYQARLAQLRAGGVAGTAGPPASLSPGLAMPAVPAGGRNNVAQFGNSGQGDRWKLDSQPEGPRTPFELRAGFVVPATLISGINSDLPGQIMAQVSQHVYDTPTGKHLLIPQGSRLVGSYSSDVAFGQARVLVAWQRIVFPDGKALDIGAMPGADSAGYAGFNDQVNNHYVRLFASAFLMSGVTAGITYSQRRNQGGSEEARDAGSALSEALGQQLGQVTAQLIAKNMNVAPTLEIRPGYRFNIVVTKDLTFSKPYRPFDY